MIAYGMLDDRDLALQPTMEYSHVFLLKGDFI